MSDTLIGGTLYAASFNVSNPAGNQDPALVKIQVWNEIRGRAMTHASGLAAPLIIPQINVSANVAQSSFIPCDANTITITLTSNVLILQK